MLFALCNIGVPTGESPTAAVVQAEWRRSTCSLEPDRTADEIARIVAVTEVRLRTTGEAGRLDGTLRDVCVEPFLPLAGARLAKRSKVAQCIFSDKSVGVTFCDLDRRFRFS